MMNNLKNLLFCRHGELAVICRKCSSKKLEIVVSDEEGGVRK